MLINNKTARKVEIDFITSMGLLQWCPNICKLFIFFVEIIIFIELE